MDELFAVVASHNVRQLREVLDHPDLNEDHLISLLRNPSITADIVQEIYDRSEWSSRYKIQAAIVGCPKTAYPLAMRLLPLLFWNDLMKVAGNYRLKPQLRKTAERFLHEKLSDLSVGERTSLARTGPRAAIHLLRSDPDPHVISGLLRNAGLTEEDVLIIANSEETAPEILSAIGSDYKWSLHYAVRLALARNSSTPLHLALSFLSKLTRQDLLSLVKAPQTPELLREAAGRILDGNY